MSNALMAMAPELELSTDRSPLFLDPELRPERAAVAKAYNAILPIGNEPVAIA
jgi:hypothetical protein